MVKVPVKRGIWAVAMVVAGMAQGFDNPITAQLEGAVMSHGGRYYAMDGSTNGHIMVSDDLVNWSEPTAVLPADVPGPYELMYRNGLFYLYAQGTGFAIADDPLNSFTMAKKMDSEAEQTRMYQDRGGYLYSVHRRGGSSGEGEIWLRRYASPWKPVDRANQLLDGRRGMWDSLDSADLGEPEFFQHRGNYYLLYAANHPSPRTGLREVGIAVNEEARRLENEDKMTDPVLTRNAEDLSYTYTTILPSGEFGEWRGRYTLREPGADWMKPGVKLSGWRSGNGGFGAPDEVEGAQLFSCRTRWDTDVIHLRRAFDCPRGIPERPVLNIRHEGPVWVYINGKLAYESKEPSISYSNIDITEAVAGVIRDRDNVIAVRSISAPNAEYRYIDFGLLDAGQMPVHPAVYGLNGPRILTGPNGIEKWAAYQAWWNGKPGTGLDRVFFFDQELYIHGPTTAASEGYHPPPTQPSFRDMFFDESDEAWTNRWNRVSGDWSVTNGVLRQSAPTGVAKAYLNRAPMSNYLFELDVRFPPHGDGRVGVVAWSDGDMDLIITINPKKREWTYHVEPGSVSPRRKRLPNTFQFLEEPPGKSGFKTPTHRLRVTKNGGYFDISLNGIALTAEKPVITKAMGAGVPGLYCSGSVAEFDAVVQTIGWEEHDEGMTGWGDAADGTRLGGEWRPHRDLGMQQRSHSKVGRVFKGDLLDQYEFTVNAKLEEYQDGKDRLYGVFPVYADQDNWLKAMIDTRERYLLITGRIDGKDIQPKRAPLGVILPRRHLYDKTTAHRDITSWVYELRSESIITGMDVRWLEGDFDHLRQQFSLPMDDMIIRYARLRRGRRPNLWEDGRFRDADEPKPQQLQPNVFNEIRFREEEANYLGFGFYTKGTIVVDRDTGEYIRTYTAGETIAADERLITNTNESDTMSRPQSAYIHLAVETSYFFRCVKLADRVFIELNGRPMIEVEGSWPPSQVGVITEGQPTYYNGTTLFHIPKDSE